MDDPLYQIEQFLSQNGASSYLNYLLQFYRDSIVRGEIRVILAPVDPALQRLVDRSNKSLDEIIAIPEGRSILDNFLSATPLNTVKPIYLAVNGSTYGNTLAELQTNLKMKATSRIGNIDVATIDGIINMPGQLDKLKKTQKPQSLPIQKSTPLRIQSPKSPRTPISVQNLAVMSTQTSRTSAVQSKSDTLSAVDLFRGRSSGRLYAFGYGYEGQLGLGDYKDRYKATLVPTIDNPAMVSCGARHTSILAGGQLYAAGAIGIVYWNSPKQGYSKPTIVPQADGSTFTASGDENTAVIIGRQLYMFGAATLNQLRSDQQGLVLVPNLNNVTFVACGTRHTAVVDSGKLYTFGSGHNGVLGLGDNNNRIVPTLVPGLNNVSMVACGDNHTAVVANGQLYTFGLGSSGKLGYKNSNIQYTPRLVEGLNNVSMVACGLAHTAVVANGQLYTFGYGYKWALGLFNNEPQYEPALVEDLDNVTFVACGKNHTAVIANSKLYTFGDNTFGQRADSDYSSAKGLIPVSNLNNVTFVACGDNHTAVIAD